MSFATNLRRIRESQGLTLTAMAKALGLSVNTFSLYEKGTNEPTLYNLKRIAQFLDVSVDTLLIGSSEEIKNDWELALRLWDMCGFRVIEVEGEYVRIEPPAEATECAPLEMRRSDFLRLTRTINKESQKWHPDDRQLAAAQFEVWARTVTNRRAALRRANPFDMIGNFLPLEYLSQPPKAAGIVKASE